MGNTNVALMGNTLLENTFSMGNTKCFIHRKHKCCIDGKYISEKHIMFCLWETQMLHWWEIN
jgi:hypothetical protein